MRHAQKKLADKIKYTRVAVAVKRAFEARGKNRMQSSCVRWNEFDDAYRHRVDP